MKRPIQLCALVGIGLTTLFLNTCIMEERIVDFVVNEEGCGDFFEIQTTANYTNSALIDYADEIDNALDDNGLSRSQIKTIRIVSGTYVVKRFSHDHDWNLSGTVTVSRGDASDGPDTLMRYSNLTLDEAAVGIAMPIALHEDGVALLHQAIDDYLAGGNPTLVLTVTSGTIIPAPSLTDVLNFDWSACLRSHVVVVDTLDVPDPL